MAAPLIKLFTQPHQAWQQVRGQEAQAPRQFVGHLLLMALIPVVCLFIGTTQVGWLINDNERAWLTVRSALQFCALLYLTQLIAIWVLSQFVQWLSRGSDPRPSFNQCIGFSTYIAAPFFIAGIAALYPSRWLFGLVLAIAAIWSSWLLLAGAPAFMRPPEGKGMLYALLVWIVAVLVALVALWLISMMWQGLGPEYVRQTLGDVIP